MKLGKITALAVVATGVLIAGAPAAFAAAPDVSSIDSGLSNLSKVGKAAKKQARASKSKAFTRVDRDLTRLGDNVHQLRKKDDEINFLVSSLVGTITPILTQLGAAAQSYANFEYGVVQLYSGTSAIPGAFLATPRLDPTVEQSTVTGQFPCASSGGCTAGDTLGAKVAIRSANPTANDAKSTAYCRITASQRKATGAGPATLEQFVTSTPNAGFNGAPAYAVERSALVPTDAAELQTFPLSPVSTDKLVDLTGASNSGGVNNGAPAAGGFALSSTGAAGMINVTLSCLSVPKS